jgi:hypothetical protein
MVTPQAGACPAVNEAQTQTKPMQASGYKNFND